MARVKTGQPLGGSLGLKKASVSGTLCSLLRYVFSLFLWTFFCLSAELSDFPVNAEMGGCGAGQVGQLLAAGPVRCGQDFRISGLIS